jgi:phospholipid/cholesterol/gamma-HCH transport system substrate-binding protein
MRQSRSIELATGFFAALGFAAMFFMVTQITNRSPTFGDAGFHLEADFDNVGSLKEGAPVSMSGVSVGRVESIRFDQGTYQAHVVLRIQPQYNRIPDDSDAAIFTAGLLGGQYVGLQAGGSETFYRDGGHIELTQSAIVLEELISKFLFSFASKEADQKTASPAQSP